MVAILRRHHDFTFERKKKRKVDKNLTLYYNVIQAKEVVSVAQANQATLSVRLDSEDKKKFEEFCSRTGMNVSVCVNMFVKAVLRERKLPFEVKQIKADEK